MYNQVFPGQVPEDVLGSGVIGRTVTDYNPWAALGVASANRPGGQPSAQEQDILDRSLFGQTARLDLGNARDAQTAKNNLVSNFSNPSWHAGEPGGYTNLATEAYNSMGGRLDRPIAPNFGSLSMPNAPDLNQLRAPTAPSISQLGSLPSANDLSNTMYNTYNKFARGNPNFQSAQAQALRGGDVLQTALAALQQQGGAMDQYVNPLVSATENASKQALAKANTELMSRFAGEGAFMSGPMMNALGNNTSEYGVNLAREIGGIRLQAANDQANRIYSGATSQAQIQAQQALGLSEQYAAMARETGSQQAALAASAYKAKADMLSNSYATQGSMYNKQADFLNQRYGTQASMYNNQLDSLDNTFATQMGGYTAQNQLAQDQATKRARDLMDQYGLGVDQAMQIAQAQQQNEQGALGNLRRDYLQPGEQQFAILKSLMGFPSVSKTIDGGFDVGEAVSAVGRAVAAYYTMGASEAARGSANGGDAT